MTEKSIPKEFQAAFRSLVIALQPRALEKDTERVYYAALQQWPPNLLRAAALRLAQTKTFFPTTGEWALTAREIHREQRQSLASEPIDLAAPFACESCQDTGSVYAQCPGDSTCGRVHKHASHGFVCVCACRLTNENYQRARASEPRRGTDGD